MEPKTMPSSQAKLLADDPDDEVTQPGGACPPTKLISFEEAQVLGPTPSNEDYYRHLTAALDDALNLNGQNTP
jgi:hypothetical protein